MQPSRFVIGGCSATGTYELVIPSTLIEKVEMSKGEDIESENVESNNYSDAERYNC